jgi:hypothetical protein
MKVGELQKNDAYEPGAWHDNHIHGFTIREGEDGAGQLVLDIDHILEWLPPKAGCYSFMISPAYLVFHEINDLVISIDYASLPAAIQPMSIAQIERQEITYPSGYKSFQWRIEINWPRGEITFKGSGFSLELRARPIESSSQALSPEQRQTMLAPDNALKADGVPLRP